MIGGEVSENEKISMSIQTTKSIKVGINFDDAERYNNLFDEIINDSKLCMRVNLNGKGIYNDVLSFLRK